MEQRRSAAVSPLLLVTLGALVLRLVFVFCEPQNRIAGDEITWTTWALGASEGLTSPRVGFSPFRWELIFYPPLYPYFVAGLATLFGSLLAVKCAQAALSALLVLAVGRLAQAAFGARAALAAALMAAVYPELIWFAAHFWSETLFLTLAWWGFERLVRSDQLACPAPPRSTARNARLVIPLLAGAWLLGTLRLVWGHDLEAGAGALLVLLSLAGLATLWRFTLRGDSARVAALAAGALFGLAILTRETLLYFAPLAALWLAWRRTDGVARAALFVASMVLVVSPWTYRNYVVTHAFLPVATSGSLNLWQGNTTLPRHEVYARSEAVRGPGHVRIAQHRYNQRMAREAIAARQPWWLFEKLASEMPRFWEADSLVLIHLKQKRAYGPFVPAVAIAVAVVVLAPYLCLLALGVLGTLRLPLGRATALLLMFLGYHNLVHVVSHGFGRYRLPVLPVVLLVAASIAVPARDAPSARRFALAALIAVILGLCVLPSLERQALDPAFRTPARAAQASSVGPARSVPLRGGPARGELVPDHRP